MPGHRFAAAALVLATGAVVSGSALAQACAKPVYLTFDTGHMGIAPLVADVLKRQNVHVTFFAAAERTQTDGDSLDNHWAPWWKARAAEGHEFASHTYDHVYWRGDVKGVEPRFRVRPTAGGLANREFTWTAAQYCEEITKASDRLQVHVTSVTHAIRRLEANKLVQRVPHPTDGRTTLVQITDLGRSTVEDATVTLNEQVFSDIGISDGESQALVSSIETLRQNAGDF